MAGIATIAGAAYAMAQVGGEVVLTLKELEETSEIAHANADAVDALVDLHEQEAAEEAYEENLAALMQQIADQMQELERLRAELGEREE